MANKNKNGKSLRILLIGMVALLLITAGALLIMSNNQRDSSRTQTLPTPKPASDTSLISSLIGEDTTGDTDLPDTDPDSEKYADITIIGDDSDIPVISATPVPTAKPVPTPQPTPVPTPTPKPEPVSLVITAAGDCTLGGDGNTKGAIKRFEDYAAKNGYEYYFKNVEELFLEDDITIVNLKCALTESTARRGGRKYNFKGSTANVSLLTGVDVVTDANNHSYDYKEAGFNDTKAAIEGKGIGFAGYEYTYVSEYKGVRVGVMAVSAAEYKKDKIVSIIKKLKDEENCRIVIASVFWGDKTKEKPNKTQYNLACAMIDAGCDLVLGNQANAMSGIHQYKGKYIVYSTGNFCYGGSKNPQDKDCFIFRQEFLLDEDGNVNDGGINVIPCRVSSVTNSNDFSPMPVTDKVAKSILNKVAKYSINVNFSAFNWKEDFIGYELGVVKHVEPTKAPENAEETKQDATSAEKPAETPVPETLPLSDLLKQNG